MIAPPNSDFLSFSESNKEDSVVELSIVLIVHLFEHVVDGRLQYGTLQRVFPGACNHFKYVISPISRVGMDVSGL